MIKYFYILIFLITISCTNKPKTIFICGDHECINNKEAKQYFEENLSLEVKLLSNKKKAEIDLVELNMERSETKKVSINEKKSTRKKLRILSTNEVKQIKSRIKKNKKTNKIIPKKKIINKVVKKQTEKIKTKKEKKIVDDVCAVVKKCDIEEISKYLIKEGKKKSFPDITIRQ